MLPLCTLLSSDSMALAALCEQLYTFHCSKMEVQGLQCLNKPPVRNTLPYKGTDMQWCSSLSM